MFVCHLSETSLKKLCVLQKESMGNVNHSCRVLMPKYKSCISPFSTVFNYPLYFGVTSSNPNLHV